MHCARCVLYIVQGYLYPQDYVSLENALKLAIATRQRRQHAACKVFAGYTRKILYLFAEFQVSERLRRGPEFLRDYLMGLIIT